MGEFAKWLLHEDRKELFEHLYATALNVVFLALAALLLWPMGRAALALELAKGYWLFWILLYWTAIPVLLFQRIFGVDIDSHPDAYVISGLAVSAALQAGWSAFAALTVHGFVAGTHALIVAALYLAGLLSCYVACAIVFTLYPGSIYRVVNLWLALVSFITFSVWPAAARAAYGWCFDLISAAARAAYGWLFSLF